ncbi:MAG: aldolase/citrate lyase family protein [Pseudomonadota bacterium]
MSFRRRLLSGDPLIATWMKTPSHVIADVLGLTSLDCICLDAEHAPFDRIAIDAAVSALRAAQTPSLVRIPHLSAEHALNALDCGATGVIAPHVKSPESAEALVKMCRYGVGGRGYAGSSRSAGYTTSPMAENLRRGDDETVIVAQIEDLEALEAVDGIAAVDGVDCLFIGRIDLTIALGAASPDEGIVVEAVDAICAAGCKADKRIGMFVSNLNEIPKWRDAGASFFALKSEHAFILEGAKALRDHFDALATSTA